MLPDATTTVASAPSPDVPPYRPMFVKVPSTSPPGLFPAVITAEGIAANVKPSLVICAVARVNVASVSVFEGVAPDIAEPPYPALHVPADPPLQLPAFASHAKQPVFVASIL